MHATFSLITFLVELNIIPDGFLLGLKVTDTSGIHGSIQLTGTSIYNQ
jgi:hypothetical protein